MRAAYTLGLHREETLVIFPSKEQEFRKRLWRSLFIMDRLLALHLGRPVAVVEEECSAELLDPRRNAFEQNKNLEPHQVCTAGLEATVRSAHVIGIILRKVYLRRRVSTKLAQELADQCKQWPENLSPALHWRRASSSNRRQAIAILHANLSYCHSILLLSRPFFLYLLSSDIQKSHIDRGHAARHQGRMQKFSDACIIASIHTIALAQNAYEGRYLPRLNSAVTYSLFAAALIIFANEFARPSSNALSSQCMANAIEIMSYSGEMDPQAKRAAVILVQFRNVIRQREQLQPQPSIFQDPHRAPTQSSSRQDPYAPTLEPGFTPVPSMTTTGSYATTGSATTSANNINLSTSLPPSLPTEDSFSGFLDLNNTVLPTLSDPESSGPDEAIDFDALWGGWPGTTPSPNYATSGAGPAQGGNDVPRGPDPAGISYFEQV